MVGGEGCEVQEEGQRWAVGNTAGGEVEAAAGGATTEEPGEVVAVGAAGEPLLIRKLPTTASQRKAHPEVKIHFLTV